MATEESRKPVRARRRAVRGLGAVLLTVALGTAALPPARAAEVPVAPPDSAAADSVGTLEDAVAQAGPGTVIRLAPGIYDLTAEPYTEPTCGNCPVESTQVAATVGMIVKGDDLRILGPGDGQAVIRTHAGYGILFEDCHNCAMSGVTVTGGERDTAASATDAAIVVKRGSLSLSNCIIRDNIGDSTVVAGTVVGIIGVCGREGSVITMRGNRILRNSWDGVALYRGAQAVIEANVIDGVDLARGSRIGGGRGVGIGCTWNAFATVQGNLVRRYWKGIGAFVDAQLTARENVVEHVATWGLTLWDAGYGRPAGIFERNVVYESGACGASIVRGSELPPPPGRFVQNVLVRTGQDPRYDGGEPYCFQMPIARHAVPSAFPIAGNVLFDNRLSGGDADSEDLSSEEFRNRMRPIWDRLNAWPPLRESDFWSRFRDGS